MPARRKPDPPNSEASFEDCLAELESIVDAMENDSLPLEELILRYEKGSQILRHCEAVLATARAKVELITLRSRSGENIPPPSDSHSAPADDPADDIRLF